MNDVPDPRLAVLTNWPTQAQGGLLSGIGSAMYAQGTQMQQQEVAAQNAKSALALEELKQEWAEKLTEQRTASRERIAQLKGQGDQTKPVVAAPGSTVFFPDQWTGGGGSGKVVTVPGKPEVGSISAGGTPYEVSYDEQGNPKISYRSQTGFEPKEASYEQTPVGWVNKKQPTQRIPLSTPEKQAGYQKEYNEWNTLNTQYQLQATKAKQRALSDLALDPVYMRERDPAKRKQMETSATTEATSDLAPPKFGATLQLKVDERYGVLREVLDRAIQSNAPVDKVAKAISDTLAAFQKDTRVPLEWTPSEQDLIAKAERYYQQKQTAGTAPAPTSP